jgi:hypothetical protein
MGGRPLRSIDLPAREIQCLLRELKASSFTVVNYVMPLQSLPISAFMVAALS